MNIFHANPLQPHICFHVYLHVCFKICLRVYLEIYLRVCLHLESRVYFHFYFQTIYFIFHFFLPTYSYVNSDTSKFTSALSQRNLARPVMANTSTV